MLLPKPKRPRRPPALRPLLAIDGDSFAHRAYHALPKTIRRKGNRPAGAILGFANQLLRLYREEKPRAVIVAWDTLEEETYRHEAFPAYQSGREFDDDIIEQLAVIPEFVAACGFANARGAGYEADDFLAAAAAGEEKRCGRTLIASGDRDSFQLASPRTTILYPVRGGGAERIGPRGGARALWRRAATRAGFHCAPRRPIRQTARRARRRRHGRGDADPPLRQP
jgi:DNA polymerase-1